MSSNNLDEKALFQYISKCFQNWGMSYITPQTLKKCKKNEDQAIQPMIRLTFDLCILHIFDYQYFIDELDIHFQENDQEILEIILAHLYEIQCPFIIVKEEEEKTLITFDFTSSKYLLITCGWLMGVSNFFNQTVEKLFKRKFSNIYKPKPLNFTVLSQKYSGIIKNVNLHEHMDKFSRISYLAKILKARKYSVECLMQKKSKILKKLKKELKSIDINLNLQDVLSSGDSQQVEARQAELRQSIVFQKQNMGYRKYWWIWLDQKIIASEYAEFSTRFQDFEKLQANSNSIKYNIHIDLDFVGNYLESLDNAESKIQTIGQKINLLEIKSDKIFKEIQREILQDIKTASSQNDEKEEVPSFIGMQLKKYLNLENKIIQAPKQSKKTLTKSHEKSYKKLSETISSFISQIDAIVII